MDSSVKTILTGTLAVSTASAFGTGVYTLFRKHNHPALLVGVAAVNSGITAATFFSCREYLVSPLLVQFAPWQQYTRRRQELGLASSPTLLGAGSLSDLRTEKLLDSTLSGAVTGGLLRGLQNGRAAVVPGMATASIACAVLQYAFNELSIVRLKYISKLKEENRTVITMPGSTMPKVSSDSVSTGSSAWKTFLGALGVRVMSDDEYLDKMRRTRDGYLKRIAQLEVQVEDEKRAAERSDKS